LSTDLDLASTAAADTHTHSLTHTHTHTHTCGLIVAVVCFDLDGNEHGKAQASQAHMPPTVL